MSDRYQPRTVLNKGGSLYLTGKSASGHPSMEHATPEMLANEFTTRLDYIMAVGNPADKRRAMKDIMPRTEIDFITVMQNLNGQAEEFKDAMKKDSRGRRMLAYLEKSYTGYLAKKKAEGEKHARMRSVTDRLPFNQEPTESLKLSGAYVREQMARMEYEAATPESREADIAGSPLFSESLECNGAPTGTFTDVYDVFDSLPNNLAPVSQEEIDATLDEIVAQDAAKRERLFAEKASRRA